MVQVDVFWSYAIGSGFALAAHRQLRARRPEVPTFFGGLSTDHQLVTALLFLSLVFVPSGTWLVWGFTSWETMHAANDLPAWLVALFALTNVSQGVLGYLASRWLLWKDRPHAAYLQFVLGYFAMYFVLVHGWDGIGYRRFFSARPEQLADWTWATAGDFLGSDVAFTLYGMGLVMLPPMLGLMGRLVVNGEGSTRSIAPHVAGVLASSMVGALGSAIVASLLIHAMGWWWGVTAATLLLGYVMSRPRGPFGQLRRLAFALD